MTQERKPARRERERQPDNQKDPLKGDQPDKAGWQQNERLNGETKSCFGRRQQNQDRATENSAQKVEEIDQGMKNKSDKLSGAVETQFSSKGKISHNVK